MNTITTCYMWSNFEFMLKYEIVQLYSITHVEHTATNAKLISFIVIVILDIILLQGLPTSSILV